MSHAELPGSLEDGGLSLWIVRRLRGQGLEHHWKMPHAASEINAFEGSLFHQRIGCIFRAPHSSCLLCSRFSYQQQD